MGLIAYFRRRRERESALSPEQLAALDPSGTDTSLRAGESTSADTSSPPATSSPEESTVGAMREASGGWQSVPKSIYNAFHYARAARTGAVVQGVDYERLQELQASLMAIMKEHGIDPMDPDRGKFMDPEVQRALQDAMRKHGLQDKG